MSIKCACKNCVKRSIGCHSRCQEYKEFRAEIDKLNSQKQIDQATVHTIQVMSKRRKKRNAKH